MRERNRAGGVNGTPTTLGLVQRTTAAPGRVHARLATRVRELNARHGTLRIDERRGPSERIDVVVLPDAEIVRRNAPVGRHSGRFRDHER